MSEPVSGVYAAVPTPRLENGALDEESLRGTLAFLLAAGIRGFALNGATAEYCLVTPSELERILAVAREMLDGRAALLCGIGSAALHASLASGAAALHAGVSTLLLPMPHFFPYRQEDLIAFCRAVAGRLPADILLYNLPQFTTGLEPGTVLRLLEECPNIVGIKDSSGRLDILGTLNPPARRMVGNDSILAEALRRRYCDGVISGVASALPELILHLYAEGGDPQSPRFLQAEHSLAEFISQVSAFPVPWGIKWIAESRGIAPASFAQPVSPDRVSEARRLQTWFEGWYAATTG